jgi:hypothetical protein
MGTMSEEVKHTPGPWTVKGEVGKTLCVTDGDSAYIVDRFHLPGFRMMAEHEANARLIAASPDMLAALEAIVAPGSGAAMHREVWEKVRAAIAKAKGENS